MTRIHAIISFPRLIAQAAPKISAGAKKIGDRTTGKPLRTHENGTARIAAASKKRYLLLNKPYIARPTVVRIAGQPAKRERRKSSILFLCHSEEGSSLAPPARAGVRRSNLIIPRELLNRYASTMLTAPFNLPTVSLLPCYVSRSTCLHRPYTVVLP